MKIVYRAGNITEAEIVKGMLLSNNIEAHVSGYYLQGGIGEMAPTDLAKVHVPDEAFEEARAMIREYEESRPEQNGTQNSTKNEKRTRTRNFLITVIFVIAISVLSYWIGV